MKLEKMDLWYYFSKSYNNIIDNSFDNNFIFYVTD